MLGSHHAVDDAILALRRALRPETTLFPRGAGMRRSLRPATIARFSALGHVSLGASAPTRARQMATVLRDGLAGASSYQAKAEAMAGTGIEVVRERRPTRA